MKELNLRREPPPGYEIVTDGEFFRHREIKSGYIGTFDKRTEKDAIDFAWGVYGRRERKWTKVIKATVEIVKEVRKPSFFQRVKMLFWSKS